MKASPLSARTLRILALIGLWGLFLLGLVWETWVAPVRPGGSVLAMKALPLLLFFPGLMREQRRSAQWLSLLVWPYFAEGCARAYTDHGWSAVCASLEIALSLLLFYGAAYYARARQPG